MKSISKYWPRQIECSGVSSKWLNTMCPSVVFFLFAAALSLAVVSIFENIRDLTMQGSLNLLLRIISKDVELATCSSSNCRWWWTMWFFSWQRWSKFLYIRDTLSTLHLGCVFSSSMKCIGKNSWNEGLYTSLLHKAFLQRAKHPSTRQWVPLQLTPWHVELLICQNYHNRYMPFSEKTD